MTAEDAAVWVLADPRAGTAAQALGVAERLGIPFRAVPLEWSAAAKLPLPWPRLRQTAPGSSTTAGLVPSTTLAVVLDLGVSRVRVSSPVRRVRQYRPSLCYSSTPGSAPLRLLLAAVSSRWPRCVP